MSKKMQGNLMLFLTAIIWGAAFTAQSAGMKYVGPFTYNASRSFIAFLVLIPVTLAFRKARQAARPMSREQAKNLNRNSVVGGICCGTVLAVASAFQQTGITMTTVGKAGFITALYIILVPVLGIFLGRRVSWLVWLSVAIALLGFYLLSIKENFTIGKGDVLCLLCAVCFSIHIMVIDHFSAPSSAKGETEGLNDRTSAAPAAGRQTDGVMMSCVQFLTAGILSLIPTLLFETPTLKGIMDAKITILYAGVLSSGVAYTLQILAQRHTNPTIATLIMSLESVFAALFGWLLLHEHLSGKELAGCALVFAAVILAQIPLPISSPQQK